ncbi:type I polyketide synthase [Nonomuraea typhae]|uniref:Type I polyketide synthase n=1 Tax=Nonomuraea typhae TaxID=2603600 RepID=A0ABW7Z8I6_9ACTN
MRDRSLDVAVTGLNARFPGPDAPEKWWAALCAGEVLTSRLTPSELLAMGVPREVFTDPSYVPVRGRIADGERFDAEMFGISPREAELIDPQHRLMLEATWSALEDAGCNPLQDRLRTAVFASASPSQYLARITSRPDLDGEVLERVTVGAGRDFMAGRIAYRLGLRGPALGVLTACSSSLVAVHLAVQALNNGDCDQAVVVAASLGWPQAGYRHVRGGIMSVDGVCRPFDAQATGIVGGSGAVAVVLRPYRDIRGSAPSYGVIVGSAVNNDGSAKAGFNAPSAQGQAAVIRAALRAGDIPAASLGYLETHGTGTHVGDPIEWAAASTVLREAGAPDGGVAVGAVKANIGHLDAAAGLAGLVKALLVLQHGQIPPVANFDRLNPLLGDGPSPLRVPARLEPWAGPSPRRAGVSSFGIGGTNAHVVVEQAPPVQAPAGQSMDGERPQVVVLSAPRPAALDRAAARLVEHLDQTGPALADLAFTLRTGRAVLADRLAVVARSSSQAAQALRDGDRVLRGRAPAGGPRPLVFLLPGQGAQRPGMALPFLEQLPGFAEALRDCLDHFDRALATRVEAALRDPGFPDDELRTTALTQPALFALEYSAARALGELGLRPAAVAGHSLGEVTAACLAGVLELESAAELVAVRARAMQECPPGGMLAVTCDEEQAQALVRDSGGRLEIAASNGTVHHVLSGDTEAVQALEHHLAGRLPARLLNTTHAFHSRLIEPAVQALRDHLAGRRGGPVTVPMVTNLDGGLLEPGDEVPLDLFAAGARATVRFGDGLRAVLRRFPDAVAVEVGPGQALSGMAVAAGIEAVQLAPGGRRQPGEGPATALAALWVHGQPVDLTAYAPAGRLLHLPVSPLQGERHVAPEAALAPQETAGPLPAPPEGAAPGLRPADEVVAGWRELLGHPDPQPDADFVEQGGDSLTVIRLARRLEKVFPVEIELGDLMAARTLGEQISLVERLMAAPDKEDSDD